MNLVNTIGSCGKWRRAARAFGRDQEGATAVEFGLVALPFIALLLAIIETALLFLAGQTLETAVNDSARLIRTGQAQQDGLTGNTFKAQICSHVLVLPSCTDLLHVDVRTYSSFATVSVPNPIDATGKADYTTFLYDAGHGGDIVLVRAYYEWPTFSRLLGLNFANVGNNHLLAAVAAFKNEPFAW